MSSPPTLPTDNVAVEKIVRAGLVTKFSGITGLPNILPHRVWIDNEQDAKRQMGHLQPVTKKTEYRLLTIDLSGFEDTPRGCADNPVYYLSYTLKLSVSHMDARSDGSTSTDDYAAILMAMRDRVLKGRHVGDYSQLRLDPLKQTGARFGLDDETLINGHHATLLCRVEVTPS